MKFDFDGELFASRPYTGMIWKTVKLSIQSRKRKKTQVLTDIDTETSDIVEKLASRNSNVMGGTIFENVEGTQNYKNVLLLGMALLLPYRCRHC